MVWDRKDFSASTAEITTDHNRSQPCFDLVKRGLHHHMRFKNAENFRTEHVRLSLLLELNVTLVNKMERTKKRSSRQRGMKFAQNMQGKALQNVYFTKVADLKCYE